MKFWFICLAVVFGMAELYQWLQGLTLPTPMYGAAGLLLALLSNADQWMPRLRRNNAIPAGVAATWIDPSPEASELPAAEIQLPPVIPGSQTPAQGEPQLPNLSSNLPVAAPPAISFTIQKP